MKVGIKGQVYINLGSYATPDWARAKFVRDLTFEISKAEIQSKNKGSLWVKYLSGLMDAPLDFECDYEPDDPACALLIEAFWTEDPVDMLILDDYIETEGAEGYRAGFLATKSGFNQPLEDIMALPNALRLHANFPHEPAHVMVGANKSLTTIHGGELAP